MEIALGLALLLIPYLLGSINAAILVSRTFYGVDIRTRGSGNAGSTNMFRELGFKAGALTQVVDIGKGSLSAALPFFLHWWLPGQAHWLKGMDLELQAIICGIASVIGHLWPIYFGFKGGKGINTLLGMMLVANWATSLLCLLGWVIVLLFDKRVAVASMLAVFLYPLLTLGRALLEGSSPDWLLVAMGLCLTALVVYTHRSNLGRIARGEEPRVKWLDKVLRRQKA